MQLHLVGVEVEEVHQDQVVEGVEEEGVECLLVEAEGAGVEEAVA